MSVDWSMRKRILYVPHSFRSNALVAYVDLPWVAYPPLCMSGEGVVFGLSG